MGGDTGHPRREGCGHGAGESVHPHLWGERGGEDRKHEIRHEVGDVIPYARVLLKEACRCCFFLL